MCGDAHLRGREHQDDGHGALMRVVVLANAGRSACSAVKVVAALSWRAW